MEPNEHDHDRDPLIARALGAVPVPERSADFFDRLDEALDAVDAEPRLMAGAEAPTPSAGPRNQNRGEILPTDLTETTSDPNVADLGVRRRDKAGRRYRLLAAAASVAVVIGGVALLAGDDDSTTTVTPAGGGGPSTSESAPTSQQRALADAFDAVMTWSEAVDGNEAGAAWQLMGPGSQAYLTEQGGWDGMVSDMQEGSHAAWHRVGVQTPTPVIVEPSTGGEPDGLFSRNEKGKVYVTLLPGDQRAAVVILSAHLELEGMPEYVTDAYPLVVDDEEHWRIEPFAFGPGDTDAEFIVPGLSDRGGLEDMRPDAAIEVAAPDGDVFISFDRPDRILAMEQKAGGRWTYDPAVPFTGGEFEIVVVTRGAAWFTAHPARFFVAETEPVACENIGFTPDSEDLASEIRATAADCSEAEDVIRHVHSEMQHNFYDGPRRFEALGFECTVVTEEQELPVGHYSCIEGPARVIWDKT